MTAHSFCGIAQPIVRGVCVLSVFSYSSYSCVNHLEGGRGMGAYHPLYIRRFPWWHPCTMVYFLLLCYAV